MRYTLAFRGVPFGHVALARGSTDPVAVPVTALPAASLLSLPAKTARASWGRADARLRAEVFEAMPAGRRRRHVWGAAVKRRVGVPPVPEAWAVARALASAVDLRDQAGGVLATAYIDLVLAPGGDVPRAAVIYRDPLAAASGAVRVRPVRSDSAATSAPPAA